MKDSEFKALVALFLRASVVGDGDLVVALGNRVSAEIQKRLDEVLQQGKLDLPPKGPNE